MPPRRRRRDATGATGGAAAPSDAGELVAFAAAHVAASKSLKSPTVRSLLHSLPASSPLLAALPETLNLALAAASFSPGGDLSAARAAACLAHLLLTHPTLPPPWRELLPALAVLHDALRLLDADPALLALAASLCEDAWRAAAPGCDRLITQTLPYLLSQALTSSKKSHLRRLAALRDALPLFDYDDSESIGDFKLLLLRCFVAPVFLKLEEGRKFLAFVLGLNARLAREALELVRSQVPIGRRSVLDAYGEVLFRAWRAGEEGGWVRGEIEDGFLQGMVEAAVHATSRELATVALRVLGAFVEQRAVGGVEKLLFRLAEPVLFRSLQVANSNVRHNALHLLLDLFPFEDPDVTKDVNDSLLERQFFLLDKLLKDDCPEIRSVAVEGLCRILHLFWEVIPSPTITRFLTKIVDDISQDSCSDVRLSTLNGLIYLLENPQSHEIMKVLLLRLSNVVLDPALSVRVAAIDLLLAVRDLRSFQFNKIVGLDALLCSLANDHPRVAQKITKLLLPSYFPSKLALKEACIRCIALIKRSPTAGARFLEFAFTEGSSSRSLVELTKVSIAVALSPKGLNPEQIDGLVIASANIINSLSGEPSCLATLREFFADEKLKLLLTVAASEGARAALLSIAPVVARDNLAGLHDQCMDIVTNSVELSQQEERHQAVLAAHKLLFSSGCSDEMFEALINILQSAASRLAAKYGLEPPMPPVASLKRKTGKSLKKMPARTDQVFGEESSKSAMSSFEEELAVAAAAWQIKDLLTSEEMRKVFLESPYPEVAFSSLKVISQVCIEQCLHLDSLDLSPLLAYMSLATHSALQDIGQMDMNCSQPTIVSYLLGHLLNCFDKLLGESTPNGSSNPSSKLKQKHTQKGPSEGDAPKNTQKVVKLGTSILKFIVDTAALKLMSDNHVRCLKFASSYASYVVSAIKRHQQQNLSFEGDDLKDTLALLRSSFTYAAKLLHLVLASSSESSEAPAEAFHLASNLLDLIPCIESYAGSRSALSLVSAAKQWLPVLILGLGSSRLIGPQNGAASKLYTLGSKDFPLWLSALAKTELSDEQNDQSTDHSEHEEQAPSSFWKLVEMLVIQLKKGSPRILDSIGSVILAGLEIVLERGDCATVLGLSRFVCASLLGKDPAASEKLELMLGCLQENFFRVDRYARDKSIDEEGRKQLESAKDLIKAVLSNV